MAERDEIEALLARVESATGPDREIDYAIEFALTPFLGEHGYHRRPDDSGWYSYTPAVQGAELIAPAQSYTSSLDAIVGLIERELPGWFADADLCAPGNEGDLYGARIFPPSLQGNFEAEAPSSALALCLAFLRAKLASEKQNG